MRRRRMRCVIGGIVGLLAISSQTLDGQERPMSKQQQELWKIASARNAGWLKDEQELWKISSARHQAMIDHDGDFVQRIAAKEFLYSHASGKVDALEPFVDYVRRSIWLSMLENNLKPYLYGNVGVLIGKLKILLKSGEYYAQVSEIWVKRDGRWQFVYYQASPVAKSNWGTHAEICRSLTCAEGYVPKRQQ